MRVEQVKRGTESSTDPALHYQVWQAGADKSTREIFLRCVCGLHRLDPDAQGFAPHQHSCNGMDWDVTLELLEFDMIDGRPKR